MGVGSEGGQGWGTRVGSDGEWWGVRMVVEGGE